MKRIMLFLFPFLLLAACTPGAPSEEDIQTAIAAAEAARPTAPAIPTVTTMPSATAAPELTSTSEPTNTPPTNTPPTNTPPTNTPPTNTPEQPAAGHTPVGTIAPLNDDDAGQIYAAAIRQMYGVDHSFGGEPPEFPLVYIVSTTTAGTTLMAPVTIPQKLSPELRQAIETGLADRPFEIIWVESLDEAPVESGTGKIAGGQGIVITMGNILAQDDGTVQLPFFMVCGGLCLSGKTYVLAEVDGAWRVTGSVGAEVEG